MATTTLANRDPSDAEAYAAFDAADDQQVMAEIQGYDPEVMRRLVYRFKPRGSGNYITGLSKAGVLETVRQMNLRRLARIRIAKDLPPVIVETDTYFQVTVYAEDELNGGGQWATKRQGKEGNIFALEQALAKAQRNAMFSLIPAAYVTEMIEQFLEKTGAVHTIEPGQQQRKQIQPPKPNMTREAWGHFRAAYEELGLTIDNVLALFGEPTRELFIRNYQRCTLNELEKLLSEKLQSHGQTQEGEPGDGDDDSDDETIEGEVSPGRDDVPGDGPEEDDDDDIPDFDPRAR